MGKQEIVEVKAPTRKESSLFRGAKFEGQNGIGEKKGQARYRALVQFFEEKLFSDQETLDVLNKAFKKKVKAMTEEKLKEAARKKERKTGRKQKRKHVATEETVESDFLLSRLMSMPSLQNSLVVEL